MVRLGELQHLLALCLWLTANVTAIPFEEFYPIGEENGDALVNRTVDGSSLVIPFPLPLNFFGRFYDDIFVSSKWECHSTLLIQFLQGIVEKHRKQAWIATGMHNTVYEQSLNAEQHPHHR